MDVSPPPRQVVRFGDFEANLRSSELRRHGLKVKLGAQSFQVLGLLLENPGEVVTREELRQKLWTEDTFVDFEAGLNSAIRRLRDALGDSADQPRFIETLPRRGYRFIAPLERNGGSGEVSTDSASALAAPVPAAFWAGRRKALLVAGGFAGLVAVLLGANLGGWRDRLLGGPPRIQSLAVLPLENLTGDPGQEYFVDGMTEALITNLAQIRALRVISRTSAMRYKGTNKSLPEIAQELNVDAVVEGTVARSGDRVRVTAQLIHARTDRHLWADEYERDLRDVLSLQSEVARAVAGHIQVALTPQEEARLARARPVNPAAYRAWLYARFHSAKRTREGMRKAIEYCQQAIQEDPNYALAYTGLAEAFDLQGSLEFVPPHQAFPRAKEAAQKALALDKESAEAYTILGSIAEVYEWNFPEAERFYQRALELNPGYATAHHWYARFLGAAGRHEEALAEMKRAQELDPLSLIINNTIGLIYFWERRYDQAIEHYRRTLELDPSFVLAHSSLGSAYEQKGMHQEAVEEYLRAMALSGEKPEWIAELEKAYAVSGFPGYLQKRLEQLKELARREYIPPFAFAAGYARLGDKEEALAWLERAYAERSRYMVLLKVTPALDPLRADPRFQELVRRMNFPP